MNWSSLSIYGHSITNLFHLYLGITVESLSASKHVPVWFLFVYLIISSCFSIWIYSVRDQRCICWRSCTQTQSCSVSFKGQSASCTSLIYPYKIVRVSTLHSSLTWQIVRLISSARPCKSTSLMPQLLLCSSTPSQRQISKQTDFFESLRSLSVLQGIHKLGKIKIYKGN